MRYSIIIPVYNRPDEVAELLGSLAVQTFTDFEIIIVEDGSTISCAVEAESYRNVMSVQYFIKPNGGPGPARNFGAARAKGDWLIFLDSDTIVPSGWLSAIDNYLASCGTIAAFGGPDRASAGFTPMQKAISWSMTSFFTTGGIRGGKQKITRFFPRSFNMGIRSDVFSKMEGFAAMRFGEDVDLSMRIVEKGYETALIPDAWLYHKRRTDLAKFYRQVYNSGRARVALMRRHPGSLKLVHLFPLAFVVASVLVLPFDIFYALLILICSTLDEMHSNGGDVMAQSTTSNARDLSEAYNVGLLSVAAAYVQLWGYGIGFVAALFDHSEPVAANIDNDKFYE